MDTIGNIVYVDTRLSHPCVLFVHPIPDIVAPLHMNFHHSGKESWELVLSQLQEHYRGQTLMFHKEIWGTCHTKGGQWG